MSARDRQKLGISALVLLLLAFGAAVMASNALLGGLRIDLTANRLYTLSPGTRALLSGSRNRSIYTFSSPTRLPRTCLSFGPTPTASVKPWRNSQPNPKGD